MSGYPPSGILWPNRNKLTDRHPDYTGDIEFSNEVVESLYNQMKQGAVPKASISGWKRESQAGNKFMSITAKLWTPRDGGQQRPSQPRSQERPQQPRQQERQVQPQATFDDEIPF
jgi:hypothetical protein